MGSNFHIPFHVIPLGLLVPSFVFLICWQELLVPCLGIRLDQLFLMSGNNIHLPYLILLQYKCGASSRSWSHLHGQCLLHTVHVICMVVALSVKLHPVWKVCSNSSVIKPVDHHNTESHIFVHALFSVSIQFAQSVHFAVMFPFARSVPCHWICRVYSYFPFY